MPLPLKSPVDICGVVPYLFLLAMKRFAARVQDGKDTPLAFNFLRNLPFSNDGGRVKVGYVGRCVHPSIITLEM
jgi:hypothetical protein